MQNNTNQPDYSSLGGNPTNSNVDNSINQQSSPQNLNYSNESQTQPSQPQEQQSSQTATKAKSNNALRNIITILSLILVYPIGLFLMWFWTTWKTGVKVVITVIPCIFIFIAILGVAILVALNPVEQFRKARDAEARADAAEFLLALETYNSDNNGKYPWETNKDYDKPTLPGGIGLIATAQPWFLSMIFDGYFSRDFLKTYNGDLKTLYIWETGNETDPLMICFEPESEEFRNQAKHNLLGEELSEVGNTFGTEKAFVTQFCVP